MHKFCGLPSMVHLRQMDSCHQLTVFSILMGLEAIVTVDMPVCISEHTSEPVSPFSGRPS